MTTTAPAPRPTPKRLPKPVGILVVLGVVFALIGVLVLGGRAVVNSVFGAADYAGAGTGSVVVQVRPGESATSIGSTLVDKGVVKSTKAFVNAAKDEPRSTSVQPGFYSLRLQMAAAQALDAAARPEGARARPGDAA